MRNSYHFGKVATGIVAILSTYGAGAAGFDASTLGNGNLGVNNLVNGDFTVTSDNGSNLGTKAVVNIKGLGVSGGTVDNEIDVKRESITFTPDAPCVISEFSVAALYLSGNYGDTVNEKAEIIVNGTTSYYLQPTTGNTASWSGAFGTASNISPGLDNNDGAWKVSNPFGNLAVTSLQFKAVRLILSGDKTSADSDYTVVSIVCQPETRRIPDAGNTLALLGVSLAALGAIRSRRICS